MIWYGATYVPAPSDIDLPTIKVLDVDVPFNDDVFQYLTANVKLLKYWQLCGIDILIDAMNLTRN